MTDHRPPPPGEAACLVRAYASSQKGGIIIAEQVGDLATHERWLRTPDRYRPPSCRSCGAALHVHDLRPRLMLGSAEIATEIIRFRCADRERCGATWQIVPAFLARCLWRAWPVVEAAIEPCDDHPVPERTRRRWRGRLRSSARALVVLLADTANQAWTAIAAAVGLDGFRSDLVGEYARAMRPAVQACLAELAALTHRLTPGMRLM